MKTALTRNYDNDMKEKFEYYDFVAFVIPGAAFLGMIILLWNNDIEETQSMLFSVTFGGSLLFFVASYAMGVTLQALSKISIEKIFKCCNGGLPSSWLADHNKHCARVVSKQQLSIIKRDILRSHGYGESNHLNYGVLLTRKMLESSFYEITEVAYRSDNARRESRRALACANMMRSFCLLLCIYDILTIYKLYVISFPSPQLCEASIYMVLPIIFLCYWRYKEFSIDYAAQIYAAYTIEREKYIQEKSC